MKFDRSKYIALDLETTGEDDAYGLQPWRVQQGTGLIRALSVAEWGGDNRMKVDGVLNPSVEYIADILREAKRNNKTVIAWNTPFDVAWLLAYPELEPLVRDLPWMDGMLVWKHATCTPEYEAKGTKRKGYRLEDAVNEFYPEHVTFKGITTFHSEDSFSLKALLVRNKMDAALTLRLAERFWNMLEERQQMPLVIESASLVPVGYANLRGLCADPEVIEQMENKLTTIAAERLAELEALGATPEVLASPQQLAKLLFDDWGLPVLKMTKSKQRSTDAETLFELAPGNPRAQLVMDYREALNNKTKFVAKIAESLGYNGDNRTHPNAKVFGTYTGRMTYSSKQGKGAKEVQTGFALHQMKNDKEFRAGIVPPPGHDLVEFDAANQEFRLMAICSNDPTMLQLCLPGEDPHGFMGAQIGKVGYDWLRDTLKAGDAGDDLDHAKQFRKVGKFANLAFQYRVGVPKATVTARVKHGLDVHEPFVKQVQGTYLNSYKKMRPYWSRAARVAAKQGYAETLAGRRVQLKGNWTGPMGWSLESTAINYPIQGTGGDQKYLAIACLKPTCTKYSAHFYFELHDGVYFVVPHDKTNAFVAEAKAVLANLPYKKAWNFVPPIPLPWDCKVGDSWGNMTEVK